MWLGGELCIFKLFQRIKIVLSCLYKPFQLGVQDVLDWALPISTPEQEMLIFTLNLLDD